jgi:hypothetical protein
MALTLDREDAIANAMLDAAKKANLPSPRVIVLKADNDGAKVV